MTAIRFQRCAVDLPWARPPGHRKPQAGLPIEKCPPIIAGFLAEFYGSNDIIFAENLVGFINIEEDCTQNQVYLSSLHVARKAAGIGSAVMLFACQMADRHGVRITLLASPKGTDATQLMDWYGRFGFVKFKSGCGWMIRYPRTISE